MTQPRSTPESLLLFQGPGREMMPGGVRGRDLEDPGLVAFVAERNGYGRAGSSFPRFQAGIAQPGLNHRRVASGIGLRRPIAGVLGPIGRRNEALPGGVLQQQVLIVRR